LTDFSAQGVSSRPCVCHSTYGTPGCEHSCACCNDEGFEPEVACVVEEVRIALAEVTHLYDDGGADLDEDYDAPLSLESESTDDLVDADTDVVVSHAFPIGGSSESSIDASYDGNSLSNGTPPLVSAMKGTRAKQGIIKKFSVSWAPDVYDPPVTSDSHTVRGHQRSSRKSHYKYKPSKSSSNRSANSSKKDKKHSRHSSSGSSNRKDKKHSYRSSSSSIDRTESIVPQYRKAYSTSSRTDSHNIEFAKAYPLVQPESAAVPEAIPVLKAKEYPLVQPESAAVPEAVPVLKTIEQIKCATSCKEKPFNLLSRQFSPARYKGMFSFWSQNQLAS